MGHRQSLLIERRGGGTHSHLYVHIGRLMSAVISSLILPFWRTHLTTMEIIVIIIIMAVIWSPIYTKQTTGWHDVFRYDGGNGRRY